MEITLSDLMISIPYSHLLKDQMRFLEQLRNSTIHHCSYISETYLNTRKRVLSFSYIISEMLTTQSFTNVFYVCARKSQVQEFTNIFQQSLKSFPVQNYPLQLTINVEHTYQYKHSFSSKTISIMCWEDFIKRAISTTTDHKSLSMILIEASIIDQMMVQSLSAEFNEIVIRRGYKQMQKIQKYFRQVHEKPYWNPQQAHRKIQKSFQVAKDIMQKKKTHYQQLPSQTILINLCTIKYLIGYLQSKQIAIEKRKELPTSKSLTNFINELFNKLLLPIETFRNLANNLRVMSLNRNLQVKHLEIICDFFQKLINYHQSFDKDYPGAFRVFVNAKSNDKLNDNPCFQIKLKCLDPRIILQILLKKCSSLLIYQNFVPPKDYLRYLFTSPLPFLHIQPSHSHHSHSISNFHSKIPSEKLILEGSSESNLARNCILGLNITSTPSEDDLCGKIKGDDAEHQGNIIRAYGVFLYDVCEATTDGVVVYFPSLHHISQFKKQWQKKQKIYQQINKCKRIFEQSQYQSENIQNLQKFRKCCDIGRGGVYLVSCRGKMAQYEQFFQHYSRCIIFMGFPSVINETELKEIVSYKQSSLQKIRLEECLKHVIKCLSNCIKSMIEQKCILFVDTQFNDPAMKKWFPFISKGNLSTLQGIQIIRQFYRKNRKQMIKSILQNQIYRINSQRQLNNH